MTTEKALLRFLDYRADQMLFRGKPGIALSSEPIELTPTLNREIRKIDDTEYHVSIRVTLRQENLPFDADLSITGRFQYEGPANPDEMLKTNAVAILYPYVRTTLSMMTMLANVAPVTLPTINLAKMFEQEKQNKQQ